MSARILCLDFDGVLHAYSKGWHDGTIYDGPVPGAMDFLREAVKVFDVHIYSTRSATPEGRLAMRDAIKAWLYDALGYPDAADILYMIAFPDLKPMAFVTLDDRAITFTGTFPDLKELVAFTPWTERAAMSEQQSALPPYPYARLFSADGPEIVILPENRSEAMPTTLRDYRTDPCTADDDALCWSEAAVFWAHDSLRHAHDAVQFAEESQRLGRIAVYWCYVAIALALIGFALSLWSLG